VASPRARCVFSSRSGSATAPELAIGSDHGHSVDIEPRERGERYLDHRRSVTASSPPLRGPAPPPPPRVDRARRVSTVHGQHHEDDLHSIEGEPGHDVEGVEPGSATNSTAARASCIGSTRPYGSDPRDHAPS
jgi:hypothetical protein